VLKQYVITETEQINKRYSNQCVALSTLRQFGLIIITISNGLSSLTFFNLLTNALFKALLFMCVGGVIHSIGDSRDISFMGGAYIYTTFTSSCLIVSNFSLCDMPFCLLV
jgi:NADH-quinone oxidoreductase subunit L